MDSQNGASRAITTKYRTVMYFILIGVVCETLLLHYNTNLQSNELNKRISELEKQHGLRLKQLIRDRRSSSIDKHACKQLEMKFNKNIQFRVKRGVDERTKPVFRALNALRLQILHLANRNTASKDICKNATLVCEKGERGPRGKAGPRGFKGEMGSKGDRGAVGAQGLRGADGMIGQKGQKGDRGPRGRSIERPKVVTKLGLEVIKQESSNLTLICEATGNPTPTIRWEVDKRKVDSRYTFPVKGGLSISNINRSDEGRLQCIAENILGNDAIETNLVVHTKPNVMLTSSRIVSGGGMPLNILCNAKGKPFPKLKWKRGYGKLNAQQVFSKDNKTLTLRFNKLSVSDTGHYVCEAQNYVGHYKGLVLLTIVEKRDCSGYKENGKSGVYTINPDGRKYFRVYCDMETNGGGWTVIQRRTDGSVDFFNNWNDYKLGFGNIENEFWLGNDKIHRLTKRKNMMIRFDLEDFNGKKVYAEYKLFYIDGERDNYRLHVKSYSGTAGDSFTGHNGMQFSTRDRNGGCANNHHGAWWYIGCHLSNLNGRYLNGPHTSYADGVNWYHFKGYHYSVKKTEMKVRPAV